MNNHAELAARLDKSKIRRRGFRYMQSKCQFYDVIPRNEGTWIALLLELLS